MLVLIGLLLATATPPESAAILSSPTTPRSAEASADAKGWEVTLAHYETADQVAAVARFHAHFELDEARRELRIETNPLERHRLLNLGLRLERDHAASEAWLRQRIAEPGQTRGISGFPCYRTVTEVKDRLHALRSQYPEWVDIVDIGDTWNRINGFGGHDLSVLKLGRVGVPSEGKPAVFVMSSVHAREYSPAELTLRFAEWLLDSRAHHADARWLLEHQTIHILVHANPDGREIAETQVTQRKNTNRNFCPTSRLGVDLNRNFGFGWGAFNGSSPNACDDTFRGPSAVSEPETQSIWQYVQGIFPDRRGPGISDPAPSDTQGVFLDLHSFSNLVLWPWGFTANPSGNVSAFDAFGRRLAWFNGYRPQRAVDLYVTDGTTIDTVYGELGTASLVFELGNAFFENCGFFEREIYPRNLQALIYAAKSARAPYLLPQGPELRELTVSPDLALIGESVMLRTRADDTRFNQSFGGSQQSQTITEVRVSIGTPIWANTATTVAMQPEDGDFDSATETARLQLPSNTPGLVQGENMVYLQASDASGRAGPVSAVFVDRYTTEQIATLSGQILDATNGSSIANAVVQSPRYRSLSDAQGHYQRRLTAGNHTLQVSAEGYESGPNLPLVVTGGNSVQHDFRLTPLCPRFSEDAEQALQGWTTGGTVGTWGRQTPDALFESHSLSDSPTGNYPNAADYWLQSPLIDLAQDQSVEVSFDSLCDVEPGDRASLEYRIGNGAWNEIFRCDLNNARQRLVLRADAISGSAQVRIRFRMVSDSTINRDGWRVDKVRVRATGAACRSSHGLFANGFEA